MNLPNKRLFFYIITIIILASCSSIKPAALRKDISAFVKNSSVFSNQFTGLSVYDPIDNVFLANINEHMYFTPSSNVKVLTLATVLKTKNSDSIPTFLSEQRGDTLYLLPLGDPTFLHPDFSTQSALAFLQKNSAKQIKLVKPKASVPPYGPGWAWDDYGFEFQPERSLLPIYGNTVNVFQNDSLIVNPPFFNPFVEQSNTLSPFRNQLYNSFYVPQIASDSTNYHIPFITGNELTSRLLQDTLNKPVSWVENFEFFRSDTVYNEHFLPLLALMMLRSDNFLAEQLLINAQITSGYEQAGPFQKKITDTHFAFLSDSLIWVDGSGLSRYNMLTPMSLIQMLNNIYWSYDWKLIENVFPVGGVSGTIKNWYGADEPYVFAKTGTHRHNHALSGFLKSKSGRILIFSFMNNHHSFNNADVKIEMQSLLQSIRDAY